MYIAKKEENKALFAETGLMALLLSQAISSEMRKLLKDAGVLDELNERRLGMSAAGCCSRFPDYHVSNGLR
eukprot:5488076-Amphidinium_carterae.1